MQHLHVVAVPLRAKPLPRSGFVQRGFVRHSATTIDTYSRCLAKTQRHFGRALQELTAEDLRGYFEHLTKEVRARARTRNVYLAALKFFYDEMLDRPEVVAKIRRAKVGHTIPVVLSGREVSALLASVSSLKHRAILTSCYAAGLRIGEACAIRIEDIDSQRMQLRVPKAKSLARYTILSERLLLLLRAYYRQARPSGPYLFPGGHGRPHMSPRDALEGVSPCGARQRDPQTREDTYASSLLCHPSPRQRRRHPHGAGAARSQLGGEHWPLHEAQPRNATKLQEPAGSARHA